MILSRQHLDLNKKTVIEKLVAKAPLRQSPVFQNEACFLYLSSATEKLSIYQNESVLLKCGNYFAELIQRAPSGICEIYAIHLYPEVLKEIYKDEIPSFIKPGNKTEFACKIEHQSVIHHFIESLSFYFDNPQLVNSSLLELKLKELILLLLQTKSAETIVGLISHLFTPRKASINEIIHTHLYSNLSLNELAILAGLSLSTFKRDFQKIFNDTPASYIKEKRLIKAAELLIVSDLSISEISFQTGFNDTSHFARLFSQKYHLSPGNYRKAHKK